MTDTPSLHQTAQARRLYHHFITGGTLSEWDMTRMVSYIEDRDARIAQLEAALMGYKDEFCEHGGDLCGLLHNDSCRGCHAATALEGKKT